MLVSFLVRSARVSLIALTAAAGMTACNGVPPEVMVPSGDDTQGSTTAPPVLPGSTGTTLGPTTTVVDSTGVSASGTTSIDPPGTTSDSSSSSSDTTSGVEIPECEQLQDVYDINAVLDHLDELSAIAIANDGTRSSGTPGYDASRAYVEATLQGLGYTPTVTPFNFDFWLPVGPATMAQVLPLQFDYIYDTEFRDVTLAAPGNVNALVLPVDLQLFAGNNSTSGCEAADFAGFVAGSIALIQRGSCSFYEKVANAEAAGAVAVILFNQGSNGGNQGLIPATLATAPGNPLTTIPTVFATYPVGSFMLGTTVSLTTDTISESRETWNIVVETMGGPPQDVVMLGSHLDSVPQGPGINDNGTGVATLLEVARLVAACDGARKIRLAWWGAEEWGRLGSNAYVASLAPAELANIALYLNFDTLGSPNFIHARYDGDASSGGTGGPAGSAAIEQWFAADFMQQAIPLTETPFEGRSDYQAFIDAGVPTGGLFTGAEQLKTENEATAFGGQAGQPYDACYHLACDDIGNVDTGALEVEGRAIVRAAEAYGPLGTGSLMTAVPLAPPTLRTPEPGDAHGHGGHHPKLLDR